VRLETIPMRTCMVCRQTRSKRDLLRLVCGEDQRVRVDRTGRAPGRGGYLCREGRCVEQRLDPLRLRRAFRRTCEAGTDLAEEVRGLWRLESK
jgi:uncharacterized protein